MRSVARVLVRILVPAVLALGIAALVIVPITGNTFEVPLLTATTVAGAAVAVEVFRASRRTGRLAWEAGPALWSKRRRLPHPEAPEPLVEWEGLLAAARQERGRGRQRFLRRIGGLATPATQPLVDAMAAADATEVDELVARFIEESRSA